MSRLDTIKLFSLDLLNVPAGETVDALLQPGGRRTAVFVDARSINAAARDSAYLWALDKAEFLLPEGAGLRLAAKMEGHRSVERLDESDVLARLCRQASARGLSVFFFGGPWGAAQRAAETACKMAPGLTIAGTRDSDSDPVEQDEIPETINAACADIVLVALDVPRRDAWIARNRQRLNAALVLGVAAELDLGRGYMPHAPPLVRQAGIERLWRAGSEVRRIARSAASNAEFMLRMLARRLSGGVTPRRPHPRGKRALDLVAAVAGIVVLAPFVALIAGAIKLESRGPVLFRQTRVGQDGKLFTMLKFRSMHRDAESRCAEVLARGDRVGVCFKSRTDPRVTRVGRWLRRWSLDELPQLFNVCTGAMAIVGPRPALPHEVEAYPADARERLLLKPGLTGLWQIAGRAEISFEKMVDMDVAYVRSRSLFLDLALMTLTIRAVIIGRGAY